MPKSKIYERAAVGSALREKFVYQIEKIVWSYKLAEETLHIPATAQVPEIEVFEIYLKGDRIEEALLKTIDRVIPLPIFFYIHRKEGSVKVKAAYKRPSASDSHKWVTDGYFESEWFPPGTPAAPLPIALDLEKLYSMLLESLMPVKASQSDRSEDMEAEVARAQMIRSKEREYQRLKAKRDREKQFNKKIKLNAALHRLKDEIAKLS